MFNLKHHDNDDDGLHKWYGVPDNDKVVNTVLVGCVILLLIVVITAACGIKF